MEKEDFLKLLPKLILEDNEVKGAIITTLSGVVATKDDIKQLIEHSNKRFEALQEQMDKRFEQMDKRFEQMDKRFEAIQEQMDKRFEAIQEQMDKRFEQMDKRFEAIQEQMDKRFEAMQEQMDKRFEAMQEQMDKRFEAQNKDIKYIKAAVGSLGRRSGKALENTILELLNDKLIKENINTSEITREYLYDKEGIVFWRGYESGIDIIMQNGKIILIEIKYHATKNKIEKFVRNSKLYAHQFNKSFDELVMICLEVKSSVLRVAKQFGVKIISGSIIN